MGKNSQIQWTDATWNIARGCTKVDEDCKFCYMYRDSMDSTRYNPFQVVRTKTVFDFPLKFKQEKSECWDGKPLIFTSSLTDFFHPFIDSYREEAWDIIRKSPQFIFQILTKRPDRIKQCLPNYWSEIKDRCWLGASVGSNQGIQRALDLVRLRDIASVLFLSLEPMHSEINFRWSYYPPAGKERLANPNDWPARVFEKQERPVEVSQHELLLNIDWVIIGGESGNDKGKYRYRPCKLEWIEQIVTHCKEAKVAVFVKQLGTSLSKELKLSDRHGGNIEDFPKHLQIREFPTTLN